MFKRTFCNMVTEVMHRHIAVNVYLDGEKPGISAGFDIKEVSLVETFDYCQLLGSGHCILSNQGCHFGMEAEKDLVITPIA